MVFGQSPRHLGAHSVAGLARLELAVADFKGFAPDSIFGRDRMRLYTKVDEKNEKIAYRRIVAGREILRNHVRNNNSPATHHNLYRRNLFQRSHIDDEAIFYVALEEAIVGLVDLLDGDPLDI
jgi:hypothetical protein